MKADVIQVGQFVQVTNPDFITRIGYELGFDEAKKKVMEEHQEDIYELMRKLKVSKWDRTLEKIVGALAFDLVGKSSKRGNERKIHTAIREEFRDVQFKVVGKRIAKTGIYFPPTGGYPPDYDDYEPGGLRDCKTHVILELDIPHRLRKHGDDWLIEQHNVKVI